MSRRDPMAWLRRARGEESGMTLVELMISVALMAVVATIFTTMLTSIQTSVVKQQVRSEMNDQARMAVQSIDREVRSGNFLTVPTTTLTCGGKTCEPGYSARVWTQANAPTRGSDQCVQWVIDDRKLFRRAWLPGESTSLDGWRLIAEGIVNKNLTPATVPAGPVAAFSLTGTKVLNVDLMVNSKLGASNAPRTVPVITAIAIRNAASADPCDPEPSA